MVSRITAATAILWLSAHFPSYGVIVDDITLAQPDVVTAGGFVGGGAPRPAQPARPSSGN